MLRQGVGALAGLAACLTSAVAWAYPTARLVYSRALGAESCAPEETLRAAVAARVGYDPFFPWAKKTVVVRIAPGPSGGFVARVSLIDESGIEHGARELRAVQGCEDLLDASALTVAIAIDPRSLVPRPKVADEAPAPPPDSSPPVLPVGRAPVAPPNERSPVANAPAPEARALGLEASLGIAASMGVAPLPAAGLVLGLALRARHFSLGVELRADAPASVAARDGGSVSSWQAVASLAPCAYAGPLLFCGLAEWGQERAQGDADGGRSSWVPWWAAGGRFGVVVPLEGPTVLRVRSDVVADLSPSTLYLHGQRAWQAPPLAGSLAADVVIHFR